MTCRPTAVRVLSLFCFGGLSLLNQGSNADTIDIRWTGSAGIAPNIVGSPNGLTNTLGGPVLAESFMAPQSYTGLSALLGIAPAILEQADAIAFESQGGNPGQGAGVFNGWESTRFSNTITSFTIDHDETTLMLLPGILATGTITMADLSNYFNFDPTGKGPNSSWILIDLPNGFVDGDPPFSLTGGNLVGLGGEGTPDADAFGIISSVPEPSSICLLVGAGLACCIFRIRRNSRSNSKI